MGLDGRWSWVLKAFRTVDAIPSPNICFLPLALCAYVIEYRTMTVKLCDIQLQLYTAKSQY